MANTLNKSEKKLKQQREALNMRSFGLIQRIFKMSWKGRQSLFFLGAFWGLVIAGTTAGLALVTRYLINDVFVDGNQAAIAGIIVAIVILSIAKGIATYFHSTTNARLRKSLIGSYQRTLFSKLIRFDLMHLGERRAPEHTADLMYFTKGSAGLVMLLSNRLLKDATTFIALGSVMIAQDFYMSMAILIGAVPVLFFLKKIAGRIRELSIKQVRLNAKLSSRINEAIEGMQTVKSFNLEGKTERRFFSILEKHEEQALKINRVSALVSPFTEILAALLIVALIFFSNLQFFQWDKTPGEFAAFLTAFLFAYKPAKRLARLKIEAQKKLYAVKMMFELLDADSSHSSQNGKADVSIKQGDIEFQNVTFAYSGSTSPAVENMSFKINAGEKVAIVGRSGSGKSTIINILSGFFKAQEGTILIGGNDITILSETAVRKAVSLVSQEIFLFEGSIKSNIRDGDPEASDEEIEAASRKAQVNVFTDKLSNGLETDVGPNAASLSVGQKQRISIARAILKDAPIMILDEATSSLDGESESSIVRQAIAGALSNQTVICIAHRKSTIEAVDRVILIDDGHVVADADINTLSKNNALFQTLFHVSPSNE